MMTCLSATKLSDWLRLGERSGQWSWESEGSAIMVLRTPFRSRAALLCCRGDLRIPLAVFKASDGELQLSSESIPEGDPAFALPLERAENMGMTSLMCCLRSMVACV